MPADDTEARGKLAGKWQPADGQKSDYGTWVLEAKETGVRVIQEANGQKVAEYECNTMGRECEMQEDGRSAKVSMWFNGPRLVQMRTRGSEVVKRRFLLLGMAIARAGGYSDRSRRQNRDRANEPLPNASPIRLAADPRSLHSISRTSRPGPFAPRRNR